MLNYQRVTLPIIILYLVHAICSVLQEPQALLPQGAFFQTSRQAAEAHHVLPRRNAVLLKYSMAKNI